VVALLSIEKTLYNSGERKGRAEGLEEGLKKGLEEGRAEAARNLKKLGVAVNIISQATELTEEEIEAL